MTVDRLLLITNGINSPKVTSDSVHLDLRENAITHGSYGVSARGTWIWVNKVTQSGGGAPPLTVTVDVAEIDALRIWFREDDVAIEQLILKRDSVFQP